MHQELPGWDASVAAAFAPYAEQGMSAARVALEHRNAYVIITAAGELRAEIAGSFRHNAAERDDLPTVGDFVAVSTREHEGRATIHAVLPRRSLFARKVPGSRSALQTIAANIDTVFLVSGLDDNFNVRRIERYLLVAWESGAQPVIVLNKADLCADVASCVEEAEAVAFGTPVVALSAVTGEGLSDLMEHVRPGRTAALLGSSGVGKSTITNALAGRDVLRTGHVSESVGKGRHTTTHRELIVLPSGVVLIDTPGMRELGVWGGEEALDGTFTDVEEIAERCRFRDCTHRNEPGCAIREALESGALDASRLRSYQKLQRELAYQERRTDESAARAEKERWKQLHKQMRGTSYKRT